MLKKNPGILIKRYSILSFVLLCSIISGYQTIIVIHTAAQHNDAHKVNMSGRQRMLSQRIGKNLLLSFIAKTEESHNQFLALAVTDMTTLESNHAKLENDVLNSAMFRKNSTIKSDFVAIKQPISQMIFAVKNIDKLNKSTKNTIEISKFYNLYFTNEKNFITLMDAIVKDYEIGLQNYVSQLKNLSWIGAGMVLVIMFINGYFVVLKSIREVDKQFLKIQRHKEFQETILSCSLEGIITINTKGCITLMNKTAEKFFLQEEKSFLGKRITTLIPDFDSDYLESMQDRYEISS
jgi:PAS domain-containing protein